MSRSSNTGGSVFVLYAIILSADPHGGYAALGFGSATATPRGGYSALGFGGATADPRGGYSALCFDGAMAGDVVVLAMTGDVNVLPMACALSMAGTPPMAGTFDAYVDGFHF